MAAPRGAAAIARDWLDAMNAHRAPRLRAMLADDFAWDAGAAPPRGPDDAVTTWCAWFERLPDLVFEPLHELGHEEWAIRLLRLHATQRVAPSAVFTPRPGTDFAATRRIDLAGCAVFTVRADRITRLWTYWDESALRPATRANAHADF